MMCFRDMTFCNAVCGNMSCSRKMTEQVQEAAIRWWGSDKAPIALSDFSAHCDVYQPVFQDEQ